MTRITTGCRAGQTGDTLRAQAKCYLVFGIVFLLIGIALIVVAATTTRNFLYGVSSAPSAWGIIFLCVAWRKLRAAKLVDDRAASGPVDAAVAGSVAAQTNYYPPQQGFAAMPVTQYNNTYAGNQYPDTSPPYPGHGTYLNQGLPGAPPPYDDVTKKQ